MLDFLLLFSYNRSFWFIWRVFVVECYPMDGGCRGKLIWSNQICCWYKERSCGKLYLFYTVKD